MIVTSSVKASSQPHERYCALCAEERPEGAKVLKHISTNRIICILCLLAIAEINS